MKRYEMLVQLTLKEELLGTCSGNPELHSEYIASKAPNAELATEEVEAISLEEMEHKAMTVFPRHDGAPILYDYQIKGFFKDAAGMLRKVPNTAASKVKAYKKEIDGLIFVSPRHIPIDFKGEIGTCQRPLRASTPMGERVALACSETVPAGAVIKFKIICLCKEHLKFVQELLAYGRMRGLGQWRNSGKGRFVAQWKVKELEDEDMEASA